MHLDEQLPANHVATARATAATAVDMSSGWEQDWIQPKLEEVAADADVPIDKLPP